MNFEFRILCLCTWAWNTSVSGSVD